MAHKNIFKGFCIHTDYNNVLICKCKGFETIFSKNEFLNESEIESFQNLTKFYSPHVNKDNSLAEIKI